MFLIDYGHLFSLHAAQRVLDADSRCDRSMTRDGR
jgi:hypothetical protein